MSTTNGAEEEEDTTGRAQRSRLKKKGVGAQEGEEQAEEEEESQSRCEKWRLGVQIFFLKRPGVFCSFTFKSWVHQQ